MPPPPSAAVAAKAVMQQNAKLVDHVMRHQPSASPAASATPAGGELDSDAFDAMWEELNSEADAAVVQAPARKPPEARPAKKPAAEAVEPFIAAALAPTRHTKPVGDSDIEAIIAAAAAEMGPGEEPTSDYEKQIMGQSSALDKQMEEQMAKLNGLMKF